MSRYDLAGEGSNEYEPGSNDSVLQNKLGIVAAQTMGLVESQAYQALTVDLLATFESDQRITVSLIKDLHRKWLGGIYEFAGQFRTVNVSKEGFMFCAAPYVSGQMERYEELLASQTPCERFDREKLSRAMAELHGEFILIHPFREGNGRLGRLIVGLMAIQAGYPLLSFEMDSESQREDTRQAYFSAVRRYAVDAKDLTSFLLSALDRSVSAEES